MPRLERHRFTPTIYIGPGHRPQTSYVPPLYLESESEIAFDCREYVGAVPCSQWRPCAGCSEYDPISKRILIVHLGRHGDMLITSPLIARLKLETPSSHITWLVDEQYAPIVEMNPEVDRLLPFNWRVASQLLSEQFDLVIGLEREVAAASIVDQVRASKKVGIAHGGSNNGLYPLSPEGEQILKMDTWNDFRTKVNERSWIEIYFELCGFEYGGEPYVLEIPTPVRTKVFSYVNSVPGSWSVCLNLGGSRSTKKWPLRYWQELGSYIVASGGRVVVAGGFEEEPECRALCQFLRETNGDSGCGAVLYQALSIQEFCALPGVCDAVVTGDSLGLHAGLAHNCPTVALFGPTSPHEVVPKGHEAFVKVLRSTFECSPCAYQMSCGGVGGCMSTLTAAHVFEELSNFLDLKR